MVDLIDYVYFFFTFFHAVSSLSQDSLTQSSSVLSPFDPFLAIGRSYTTCFRSKKVRNTKRHTTETKGNRGGGERGGGRLGPGTSGLRNQRQAYQTKHSGVKYEHKWLDYCTE